jgi:hypothetical protein
VFQVDTGFFQIIQLLMASAGFGIGPNPSPASADKALAYAVADADIAISVDATSLVPGNFKVLTQLGTSADIKSSPELRDLVRKMVADVEGARGLARGMVGIDVTTDVTDATLFVRFEANAEPLMLAAIRGKFVASSIDKLGKLTGHTATNGVVAIDDSNAAALTKDGVMLVGSLSLVNARMAAGWKAPARTPESFLGKVATVIDAKPVVSVSMAMSAAARKKMLTNIGENFAADLLNRHKFASISVYRDGIGWTWEDSVRNGLDRMVMFSEGVVEGMRAFAIAPRSAAKIMLSAIDSYKGKIPMVDQMIANKANILATVQSSYSGDGNFKVTQNVDAKALRVTVRATGKTLSEVAPMGLFVAGGASAWLMGSSPSRTAPPMTKPALQPKRTR